MNLYQHAKIQVFLSPCSRDIVDFKILQFDWPRAFWYISQEPYFYEMLDLFKNTADNINSRYRANSAKNND